MNLVFFVIRSGKGLPYALEHVEFIINLLPSTKDTQNLLGNEVLHVTK